MIKCPNKNLPEWKELERLCPDTCYIVWDAFPYGIDKAPNGAPSRLFSDLLKHYNGDRDAAIKAKAKTVTAAFKAWFGDWLNPDANVNEYKDLYNKFTNGRIVFGHPGIGKTYSVEKGKYSDKFIDWDVEYNSKRDKWIEEHSRTKKGTDEYKKARNEYLIYPEKHADYMEFLTTEWYRVVQKARKENKILIASPHTLLKFFPESFDLIINMERQDFINRNVSRGGKEHDSELWKEGIDNTISNTKDIPQYLIKQGEYFEDLLDKIYLNRSVSKVVDENGEPLVVYHGGARDIEIFKTSSEESSNTGYGFYTDEKTGKKIPIDSNRTMFFSSNPYVGKSYGVIKALTTISKLYNKVQSLIETNSGDTAGVSKDVFKTLDDFYETLDELSEYNPRFEKLKEYLKTIRAKHERMKPNEVKAFRQMLIDIRKKLKEYDMYTMNYSEWDDKLHRSKEILERYNNEDGITRLLNGEIPHELLYEFKLYKKIEEQREKQGLDKISNYEEAHQTLSNTSRFYFIYDGNRLKTWDPGYYDKYVTDMSRQELQQFLDSAISSNENALNKLLNDPKYKSLSDKYDLYPVFLNIKNPLVHDYEGTFQGQGYKQSKKYSFGYIAARQVDKAINSGNDGVIYQNLYDPYLADNYGVFNSNQIKSVDNEGNFSLTDDNIKHRMLSYIKAAKEDPYADYPINKNSFNAMKSIDNSSDAIQWLLDNGLISSRFEKLAKLLQKHSVTFKVTDRLSEDGDLEVGGYSTTNKSILLYRAAFMNNRVLAETVLHEVLHHYLGDSYYKINSYHNFVDSLVKKYRSVSTKKEIDQWYGLREGGEEFINEIMSNSKFIDFLVKKDDTLWSRFKRFVAKLLARVSGNESILANSSTLDDVVNELTDMIEKISVTKPYESSSQGIVKFKKDDKIVSSLEYEAKVMRRKIQQGIESRIKAFNQYGKITANMVMRMEQELAKLQELWQKNEDKLAMINFLEHAANESKAPVKAIDKAFEEFSETGKFSLRNEQLIQMYRDFIGFYEPIIEDINEKLFVTGYFDDFTDEQYEYFGNLLTNATKDFNSLRGKYNRLLAVRFGEILKKHATESQKESIDEYLRDNTNYTSDEINWYMTYIGGMKATGDQALDIAARMINDIQNEVERKTINKAEDITRAFALIKTKDWQKFYEKDDKGKKTGNLVRKRNYGKYYRDYNAFMEELGDAPIDDKEKLKEWRIKRHKWLSEHAERRYRPEYYELFLNMSFAAQEARDSIQTEIGSILDNYLKPDGTIRIEDMPDDEWRRLQSLYQEKRRLANRYNNDGTKKSGIDLEIAEELKDINDKLAKNVSYKTNMKKFEEIMSQKKATLSKEKFDLWYKRSTMITYSEEFQKALQQLESKYYTKEYEQLAEERRELASLYRNTHDFMINTRLMPEEVKERIREIDLRMAEIREENPNNEKSDFSKIAYMERSAYYRAEKEAALERDKKNPGEYKKWFNENHYIDSKGQAVPYSYFMMMLPKDKKDIVTVPSREFSEIDPSSPYWNENFDITDPEYIQPKKSLYDNTKAYEEATSTPEMKNVYDTIVDTMNESNDKITFLKRKDNYKLPQQTGGVYAFIQGTGSVGKGLWRYVKDKFTIKDDDAEFNYESLAPDGSKLDTIATHYIKKLDNPSTISNNLAGILIMYYQMATNYELKSKLLPELKVIQNQIENREYQPGLSKKDGIIGSINNTARRIGDAIGGYIKPSSKGRTRTAMRMEKYMDINIFGSQYSSIKIGKYNIVKALLNVRNYATLVNLGVSPFIAGANLLGGMLQHITESTTGVYYTKKTATIALRNSMWNFLKIIFSGGNYRHENKLLALMNKNQISRDSSRMFKRLNYNRFARFAMNHLWFGMMSAGDYIVNGNIVTSVYLNTKYIPEEGRFMMRDEYLQKHYGEKDAGKKFSRINTITLYDVYQAKGIDTELNPRYQQYHQYVTKELEDRVANVLRYLCDRAAGTVSTSDRNIAQANALIGFTVMHKGFLLNALEDRVFKPKAYNYTIDRMDEASYRTAIRRGYELIKYAYDFLRYGRKSAELRKLDFYESYNLKRIVSEVSMIIVYNLISNLLNSGDDDDDDWGKAATKYTMARGAYEALNLYNPIDVYRSFKTLTPASTSLENLGTALFPIKMLFTDEDEGLRKKVKYGPYKGMTGWERAVWKSTPLKNIIEATDPKQKHKYLKSQLQ